MKNTTTHRTNPLHVSTPLLMLCALMMSGLSAHAATLTVTSLANTGAGTLRAQVAAAAPGDTIDFSVTGTITLTTTFIDIAKNLTITGPGAGLLTVNGDARTRIFRSSGGVVSVSGLTLTNGKANSFISNSATFIRGGAIYQTGGALTLTNCLLSNSVAFPTSASLNNSPGGAIYVVGGSLTIVSSTLSGNTATGGGAIAIESGSLQVTESTISGNRALESGGGISVSANATATVVNSTVSGNVASGQFGGGGGFDNSGRLTITQSTISGNSTDAFRPDAPADGGGGIRNLSGVLNISASTISANSARHGGGIHSRWDPFTLSNSIVAGNFLRPSSPASSPDILGTVSAGDYNLVQNNTTVILSGTHNITGQSPLLGALADNGGPTKTMALLTGSPAINAGDPAFDGTGLFDQRGTGFARVRGGRLDIGAFEVKAEAPSLIVTTTADTTDNSDDQTSLREAITFANSNADASAITFDPAVFATRQTITIGSELPGLSTPITITGSVAGVAIAGQVAAYNIFNVNSSVVANFNFLTITNGSTGIYNSGTANVNNSTITNSGRGIDNQSGATANVTNSTFTGNAPQAIYNQGMANVSSSTISVNDYGIFNVNAVTLKNTIVTNNEFGNTSGVFSISADNFVGGDAKLGALANNGGPTQTFALLAGSPAINAGSNALIPSGVTTDQRGFSRVESGSVDIGAFELDAIPPFVTINQAVAQTDPTISTPVHFTVVFSEPVTNFTNGDVTLSGSAGATTATITGSGPTYNLAVAGMTRSGSVVAAIAAGVAFDGSANGNTASTSSDNSVSYSSPGTVQSSGTIQADANGSGGFTLGFIGNPGQEYTIQFSPNLAPDSWLTLKTQAADPSGVISIIDTPPAGTVRRFYRMLLP